MAEVCGKVLAWRPREDAVLGRPHDHVCWQTAGHPVSLSTGVQVHHCRTCTLGWESDPRTKPYTGRY